MPGDFTTPQVGAGTELATIRPYQPGDDVRHIDWNVTARMHEPHVRVHIGERAMTAWLVLDVSASMQFGTALRRALRCGERCACRRPHGSRPVRIKDTIIPPSSRNKAPPANAAVTSCFSFLVASPRPRSA